MKLVEFDDARSEKAVRRVLFASDSAWHSASRY